MGQHLLGLLLIVFGIMIDSMHCMYTTTTTTTATTTTNMDPLDYRVNLWPNVRVPYVISEELDSYAREKINEAIEEFHQKTCVNFEPRLKSDQDYVHFVPHQEFGWTYVGNIGLYSPIYLAPDCQRSKPMIQHEMMYTTTTATTTTTEMDPMQDRVKLWPNGRVPYVISEGFDTNSQETINEAIEEFKQKTCVNFEPRLKSDRDYVFFDKIPNGCTSPLGKDCDGGVQYIYLAPDCQRSKADIQHEMMHTLGNV